MERAEHVQEGDKFYVVNDGAWAGVEAGRPAKPLQEGTVTRVDNTHVWVRVDGLLMRFERRQVRTAEGLARLHALSEDAWIVAGG